MPDTGIDLKQVDFSRHSLVVVMATYYTQLDDPRYAAALNTLMAYRDLNRHYPSFGVAVIVVDASPETVNQQIRQTFADMGALVLPADRGGLAPQNLQGLAFAFGHGAQVVLRQEPEKSGLAQIDNLVKIVAAVRSGCHLAVVGRDQETIHSMPYEQQITETLMSLLIASLGLPLDSAAGPRAMDATGFVMVNELNYDQIGEQWEFLWWPLLAALHQGQDIGYVECNFPYPESLTDQEELNPVFVRKRLEQAYMILAKLLTEASREYDIVPRYQADKLDDQHQPRWRRAVDYVKSLIGRNT